MIRSFFRTLKKLSATALSWQFPRRLMLGTIRCAFRNDCQSLLVNWQPWSEWTSTPGPGLRRHAAAISACSTRSLVIVDAVAQPTIWREYKSITAARNSQPS
ncbi:hypothetical protein FQZ97_1263860 [compost metagenome]